MWIPITANSSPRDQPDNSVVNEKTRAIANAGAEGDQRVEEMDEEVGPVLQLVLGSDAEVDPGQAQRPHMPTMVRTIFAQPDPDQVWAQHRRIVDHLHQVGLTDAADHLDQAGSEILAFTGFPKAHWRQIWSNNPQERLNKEIRRRTNVVGIFPTRPSIIRLVGALLAEQHDEWAIARRYMSLDSLAQARIRLIEPDQLEEVTPALETATS